MTTTVVYAVLATHDELIDVLDSDEFSLYPHFDTPSEAQAFADLFTDREVVRVTIESEEQP